MFVVDRHDLDTQTQSEYEAFEPGAVDGTDNTYELIKRLSGNSKIIITTIQKLNCAITKDYYNKYLQEVRHQKVVMIFIAVILVIAIKILSNSSVTFKFSDLQVLLYL